MIKVVHAASWLARRRFYSFSHRLYKHEPMWSEPAVWGGRKGLLSARNELMRNPHAFLMAVENGRILARVLTGTVGKQGYFALFDAENRADAVEVLMHSATEWQRAHGSKQLNGPIAPTMLDLGGAVLKNGFGGLPAFGDSYNFSYYGECLERCGLETDSDWLAYRVDLMGFDREKYRKISEWSRKRFDYEVDSGSSDRPRELADALFEIMEGEMAREDSCRLVDRLRRFLLDGMCPVVRVNKEPIGLLLTIHERGRVPRVVTMWVKEKWRRKGVTATLFDALVREADRCGWTEIDGSMVRSDNLPSRKCIETAGGRVTRCYCCYGKQV